MDNDWTRENNETELREVTIHDDSTNANEAELQDATTPDESITANELGPEPQAITLEDADEVLVITSAEVPSSRLAASLEQTFEDDDLDEPLTAAELPSQMAVELEDTASSDRSDTIVQFRNEVKRLSFRRTSVRRRSSRRAHLRGQIKHQESTGTGLRSNRDSTASLLQRYKERKDLYWPKIYRRIIKVLSFKLWEGHLKKIEGEFGNGPVSYFVFLRFLFLTNLFIFLIWFAFVCAPQLSWRLTDGKNIIDQPLRSQLHCLRQCNNTKTNSCCPPGSIMTVYECDQSNESFVINLCTDENCESDVRPKEGTEMVTVCIDESRGNCLNESSADATRYCVFDNVDPDTGVLQWIVDFVTGQGYFNRTALFYGQYYNGTINGYDMPLSYLTTTAAVYGLFLLLLVYRMGQEYNEDYVQFRHRNEFSNKLFSAWDYHITNKHVAKFKHKAMKRHFEEEVWSSEERNRKRGIKELILVIFIRFFTNLFVILCLAGAGAGIYFAIRLSLERTTTGLLTVETLITSVTVSCINLFLPPLFSFLGEVERYKTTTGKITVTLIRSVIVRLMPIVVLIASWLGNISCTQPTESEGCTSDQFRVSARSRSGECPRCWETFIGQEAYRLALVNLLIVNGAVIALETGLNILSKINFSKMKCICPFLHEDQDGKIRLVKKPPFEIPLSILDIWYTQALMWLGFFFCPYLPLITIATLVLHFYVRRYSMKYNCAPDTKPFTGARRNFTFLALLLLLLFLILIPIGYTITRLQPSTECGPFRGKPFMYSVVNETISDLNCNARKAVSFLGSAGFIAPVMILLLLIIYSFIIVMRSRNQTISLLKKQLVLDEADNVLLRERAS